MEPASDSDERSRRLGRFHRRFDVIDERIGKIEPACELVEIAAFGAGIGIDRQARSGIKFDLLLLGVAGTLTLLVGVPPVSRLFSLPDALPASQVAMALSVPAAIAAMAGWRWLRRMQVRRRQCRELQDR